MLAGGAVRDPNFASVVLLCHFDGANGSTTFIDSSPSAHTLTAVNGTVVTTTTPKFGTGCGDFTSSVTSAITTGNASDFNFSNGKFTVEAWAYFTSSPGSNVNGIVTQWLTSNLGFFFGVVSGNLAFFYSTTGSDNPNVGASYTPSLNTWIHLAADRDASNVLRVYANGVVVASATVSSTIFASTQQAFISSDANGDHSFPGHLDEVRVTKGVARYGGGFTPPTAVFPNS
jgi:hypothetical protein